MIDTIIEGHLNVLRKEKDLNDQFDQYKFNSGIKGI